METIKEFCNRMRDEFMHEPTTCGMFHIWLEERIRPFIEERERNFYQTVLDASLQEIWNDR